MQRLRRWLDNLRARDAHAARWVVIDTETSGLDATRDRLLAIGGVALDADGVCASDSFEVVIRNTAPAPRDNIALHGIGREAQREGVPHAAALAAFAGWARDAPRFAFHAEFDRAFVARCAREAGVTLPAAPWIDIAPLATALSHDPSGAVRTTLDEWLTAYEIGCDSRHNAASDAFATAQLLLRLRTQAQRQGLTGVRRLARIARQAKWLGAR